MPTTPLADTFQEVLDSLPSDWTDLELDLRIHDEERYIDAAVYLVQVNAQPYSKHEWHWRILVAHTFGHAAAPQAVLGTLRLLDQAGLAGDIAVQQVRTGRIEITHWWGRPESVKNEFKQLRSQ